MSGEMRDASFIPSDFRANFKDVIAKRRDLTKIDGGRMTTPGSLTTYNAGLALGVVTATGKFAPYNNSNSDGTEVCVGILAETVQIDTSGNFGEILVIRGGILFADLLIGLDSAGKVDLGAKSYVDHGVNLLSF